MILWPGAPDLPKTVLLSGFDYGFADGRTRTDMSRGFAKSRGASRGAPQAVSCALNLSNAQLQRMTRFWNEDTAGGNLWFVLPDPVLDGRTVEDETGAVITDETGAPLTISALWLARFNSGMPAISGLGADYFACNFGLDVRPL